MAFAAEREPIPSFVFSTETHRESERLDAWQNEVANLFDVVPVVDPRAFSGEIDGHLLDGIVVGQTRFAAQRYRRDRRLVARTGLDAYLVQLYTDGGFDGYADASEISVRAGDVCVFDLTETLATQAVQSSTITLVVPKLLVDRHWHARAPVNGLVMQGSSAIGQVLGSHLASVGRAMPSMTAGEAPVLATATTRLIADCLAYCTNGSTAGSALLQSLHARAIHYIRANLGSLDLSPDMICAALKVSRPHLYRAFKDKGGVTRAILAQRLRAALLELANPSRRSETVGSIAYRCGFTSDSHFARLFRETFGVRPTEIRDLPSVRVPSGNEESGLPGWLSLPLFAHA